MKMRDFIVIVESELVSEISQVGPLDQGEEDYEERKLGERFREFDPVKVANLEDSDELWLSKTPTGHIYAFAVDSWGNPIACMALDKLASKRFRVKMIFVTDAHRGRGVAYNLYLGVLRYGFTLESDMDQTPGGRAGDLGQARAGLSSPGLLDRRSWRLRRH